MTRKKNRFNSNQWNRIRLQMMLFETSCRSTNLNKSRQIWLTLSHERQQRFKQLTRFFLRFLTHSRYSTRTWCIYSEREETTTRQELNNSHSQLQSFCHRKFEKFISIQQTATPLWSIITRVCCGFAQIIIKWRKNETKERFLNNLSIKNLMFVIKSQRCLPNVLSFHAACWRFWRYVN